MCSEFKSCADITYRGLTCRINRHGGKGAEEERSKYSKRRYNSGAEDLPAVKRGTYIHPYLAVSSSRPPND
jgi:hypothetical protein